MATKTKLPLPTSEELDRLRAAAVSKGAQYIAAQDAYASASAAEDFAFSEWIKAKNALRDAAVRFCADVGVDPTDAPAPRDTDKEAT